MKLFGRFRKAKAPAQPAQPAQPEPEPEPADIGVGILPYDPTVAMLGAENRGGVTCYIDALLFAMFCRLDAFECLLEADFPKGPTASLARLLRIWVNMLRSGRLIRTDLTKRIQDAFGDCGWPDARFLEQQDTSEAFAFLTETLELPLLSLQVDLFHQGKRDDDDHKVVHERLLNLAIPPDPEGKGIKLEDCLEEYFNTQVDVLRDSEVMKQSQSSISARNPRLFLREGEPLPSVFEIENASGGGTLTSSPVDMAPLHRFPTHSSIVSAPATNETSAADGETAGDSSASRAGSRRNTTRQRSDSIIQRILLDENGKPIAADSSQPGGRPRKGSVVVKAVTIPAWQFFRLIPWNAVSMSVSNSEPQTNSDVAKKFQQRPVVGICLKRYVMTETGKPKRHDTFIDIPDSLRLPHFMVGDGQNAEEELYGLNTGYKLVLQSVICHRGDSVYSGHYIAFARVAPKVLTGNRRHEFDPPPDYEEAQWVLFDDLEERRVVYVDDFKKALEKEMPYLLFYQMVPTVEVSCPSPPSY